MLENLLRQPFQRVFIEKPIGYINRYSAIEANQLTLLSGIFGLMTFPTLVFGYPLWAIGSLLLSGYLDVMDGSLARLKEQSSAVGTVLDIMTDRLVEFTVIFALFSVAPDRGQASLLMLGSILLCVTSFLVVGIFSKNHSDKSFHYSPGLIERAEAFCFFILMMLFPNAFYLLAILFSGLTFWTAFWRLKEFIKQAP